LTENALPVLPVRLIIVSDYLTPDWRRGAASGGAPMRRIRAAFRLK
jgi:hypothetical protein